MSHQFNVNVSLSRTPTYSINESKQSMSQSNLNRSVLVESTARLHMGFFDLNGQTGRKFGSIGVSLASPEIKLKVQASEDVEVVLPQACGVEVEQKILALSEQLKSKWLLQQSFKVIVETLLPAHAGLGSGTQLALSIGSAISNFFNLNLTTEEIALATGRGGRSGIGIAAFDQGGVLIDGGQRQQPSEASAVPPLLARYDFPAEWRIVLITDESQSGVHGATEKTAFKTLPEFPQRSSEQLCHSVLMKAMPAIVEQDLMAFGESIQLLQAVTGDHFSPIQGGRYANRNVAEVLSYLASKGAPCFGQSSWGPTGFAVFAGESEAEVQLKAMQKAFSHLPLGWQLTQAKNAGATVKIST